MATAGGRRGPKRSKRAHDTSLEDFQHLGGQIMQRSPPSDLLTLVPEYNGFEKFDERFVTFFGVAPIVACIVWRMIMEPVFSLDNPHTHPLSEADPSHLLWALMFLKIYAEDSVLCALAGGREANAVDEKTFRKWSRAFVYEIAFLISEVILFENRRMGDLGLDCLMTIDCTDCFISHAKHSVAAFNSYKHKRSSLRYEIGICIATGWICWVFGPLPAGDWNDIEIFRLSLKHELDENERVEADDGYIGEDPSKTVVPKSMVHPQDDKIKYVRTKVRRRHETANNALKEFKVLGGRSFRQDQEFHGPCFRACVVLKQLGIENGKPLFDCNDYMETMAEYQEQQEH